MKTFWASLLVALFAFAAPLWALESGHDCADGNDQDLEWQQQQTKQSKPVTS
jgi:hypothetical protein